MPRAERPIILEVTALRRPRLSLLGRFSLLSLVLVAALGVVVGTVLHQRVEQRAIANANRLATAAAEVAAVGTVATSDLRGPVSGPRLGALDTTLGGALKAICAARLKLYNARGVIVYADDHAAIGTRASDGDIEEALSGEHLSDIARGTADTGHGVEALESYVPLRLAGSPRINGVLELYLPYAPVRADIARDTRTLVGLLAAGLLILWAALFRVVQRASRRLRRIALDDELTGLANRARLHHQGRRLLAGSDAGLSALLLVDLDRFKEVNDTLGHDQGDALLRHAAVRLAEALRPGDLLARLGADEFAVLCPGLPTRSAAAEIAARLHDALGRPFDLAGVAIELDASIGIALSPDHGGEVATLLRHADVAMELAKQDRTRTETYDRSRDGHSTDRLKLLGELRRALAEGELVLHFQPKVGAGLDGGSVTGVEALIRWEHPDRGLLGPGTFMPLAVRTGLVGPLTRWVLDTALAQAAAWRARGIELSVAVNLAPPNVLDVRLPDLVAELLGRHGVPPRLLICEISEDTVLADPQRTIASIRRLRSMGVGLALDDFGAGQTSLSYLKQMPLDELKIDRSFVAGMASDPHDRAIVGAAIALGRDLGLRVVAEGVEDDAVLRDLTARRCDAVQGFLFSRALPAAELEAWLAERAAPHWTA